MCINIVYLVIATGFCDVETQRTDHGTYTWRETRSGSCDVQDCVYDPKPEFPKGKARRCCIGPHQWKKYSGVECISEATHELIKLGKVCSRFAPSFPSIFVYTNNKVVDVSGK